MAKSALSQWQPGPTLKDKVTEHWESKLREQMRDRKTLEYMNPEVCAVGVVHPVWRFCRTSADIYMASVKVRLMVKRYPLSGETYSGARRRERCTLCGEAPETTEHFLLECPFLTHSRRAYMARIEACLSGHGKSISICPKIKCKICMIECYDIVYTRQDRV